MEVTLRRLGTSRSGSGFPPAHQGRSGEEIAFYKVNHLAKANRKGVLQDPDDTVSRDTAAQLRAEIFPPGSIVYAKVGAALLLGRIRTLGRPSCIDNNMSAFVSNNSVDSRYLYYLMSTIQFARLVNPGAVPSLSDKNVLDTKVLVPDADLQRKLADYLDRETQRIDELIAEQRGLIETLLERRQAVVDTGAELAGFGNVRLRYMFAPSDERNRPNETVLSVYREYGVIPKGSRDGNHNVTPDDVSRYLLVRPDDLVVNRMKAWQGSLGVSEHRGIVSGDYEVLRPKTDRLLPKFAHLYLRSARMVGEYVVRSTGIRPSQWRLYWKQMADIEIPVPPLQKQREIVSFIEEQTARIDALIAESDDLIALSHERRAALITATVTGQIDVRAAA